ncbi:hypothetical protein H4R34_001229 [Dimargaris verticillata]|uniref:Uncharacterized protein n=1 Tax=Dimargaris verticillata TaxID=2761393 RepID=A0A9W8B8W7_9FUNG|nr:hypothetical protein H4R34_001229 [Dimargaris verticillata]
MLERAALFGAQFGIRDYELARNELELGLQDAVPKLLSTKFDLAYGDERMNLPKCQERFGVPAELKKVERLEDVAKLLIHRHDYEMALQLRR